MVHVERSNTILYCRRWPDAVRFYRQVLGLPVTFENDWFVEFAAGPGAFVSIADAGRASIAPGDGAGVTLSWRVPDVDATRAELLGAGVDVGETETRWGARVLDVFDPVGNRIELWSGTAPDG